MNLKLRTSELAFNHCVCLVFYSGVTIEGKNAVVLGRSNIVGIPVALLLMHRNATVTIVHSKTVNAAEVRQWLRSTNVQPFAAHCTC